MWLVGSPWPMCSDLLNINATVRCTALVSHRHSEHQNQVRWLLIKYSQAWYHGQKHSVPRCIRHGQSQVWLLINVDSEDPDNRDWQHCNTPKAGPCSCHDYKHHRTSVCLKCSCSSWLQISDADGYMADIQVTLQVSYHLRATAVLTCDMMVRREDLCV